MTKVTVWLTSPIPFKYLDALSIKCGYYWVSSSLGEPFECFVSLNENKAVQFYGVVDG